MAPALEALTKVNFHDQSVLNSASELVGLAVAETIDHISNVTTEMYGDKIVPLETRNLMVEKLKSLKLWVFFPDDVFNITEISGFYDEIAFEGSKTAVELFAKFENNYWKLWANPNKWTPTLQRITGQDFIHYHTDLNALSEYCFINEVSFIDNTVIFLDIPLYWSFYPLFHPNRSRFFNMATLYAQVIDRIRQGLEEEFSYSSLLAFLSPFKMADESYVRWESNGGTELQLPAFKLTNRQMFWVSAIHTQSQKFTKNPTPGANDAHIYVNQNANYAFKTYPNFREAFQCGLTSAELKQLEDFRDTYNTKLG